MKILVVGNGYVSRVGGSLYKHKNEVAFIRQLSESAGEILWLEAVVEVDSIVDDFNSELCPENVEMLNRQAVPSGFFGKICNYFLFALKFLIFARQADFVYLFYPGNHSVVCGVLAKLLRKKTGLYVRGDFVLGNPVHRSVVKSASFIMANGIKFIDKIAGVNSEVALVSPMIDFSLKDTHIRTCRRPGDVIKILFVGRIEKDKGVYILVKAAENLRHRGFRFQLDVIGGGPEFDSLKKQVEDMGLSENVTLHGNVSDRNLLLSFYRSAEIFVCPSLHEGFPRVLYEAMLASLAIISTPVGSIPALMTDQENCLFIEPKNSNDLADKIHQLAGNNSLMNKIGNSSRETIVEYLGRFTQTHAEQVFARICKASFGAK